MDTKALSFEEVVTVKRIVCVSALLASISLAGLGASTAYGAAPNGWGSDVNAAFEQARNANKPLVVLVAATGCPACEQQEREIAKPFVSRALGRAIKVRAEAGANPKLMQRYAVQGTPTILAFSPDTGYSEPIFNYTGVLSSSEFRTLGQNINPSNPGQNANSSVPSRR